MVSPYFNWKSQGLIKLSTPATVDNYQVVVTIPWLPAMAYDFRDLRFTTKTGTKLYYWIESSTNFTSAKVWIKVPINTADFFFYYGNGQAVSESGATNIFDLYDDFLGSSIQSSLWQNVGSPSITVGSGRVNITPTSSNNWSVGLQSKLTGTDYIVDIYIGSNSSAYDPAVMFRTNSNFSAGELIYSTGGGAGQIGIGRKTAATSYSAVGTAAGNFPINAWKTFTIAVHGTTLDVYDNGTLARTQSDASMAASGNCVAFSDYYGNSSVVYIDWVRVRKYQSTEPTLTVFSHYPNPDYNIYFSSMDVYSASTTLKLTPGLTAKNQIYPSTVLKLALSANNKDSLSVSSALKLSTNINISSEVSISTSTALKLAIAFSNKDTFPISSTLKLSISTVSKNLILPSTTLKLSPSNVTKDTIPISTALVLISSARLKQSSVVSTGLKLAVSSITKDKFRVATIIKLSPSVFSRSGVICGTVLKLSPHVAPLKLFVNLKQNYLITGGTVEISRRIDDSYWKMVAKQVGSEVPPAYAHVYWDDTDTWNVSHMLFYGITPDVQASIKLADKSNALTCYDYGFHLCKQCIQDDAQLLFLGTYHPTWDSWINYFLQETGIVPYRINVCSIPAIQISLSATTTKLDAIKKICDATGFVFYISWKEVNPDGSPSNNSKIWNPTAYFVSAGDIDDPTIGLDLPLPVTISYSDDIVVGIPRIQQNPDDIVNRVRTACQDSSGNWYRAKWETPDVTAKETIPKEYTENPCPGYDQTTCQARANMWGDFFQNPPYQVDIDFIRRFDLQLYQKIRLDPNDSNWTTEAPMVQSLGWLRITSINITSGLADGKITITAVTEKNFALQLKRMSVTDGNFASQMSKVANYAVNSQPDNKTGVVDKTNNVINWTDGTQSPL